MTVASYGHFPGSRSLLRGPVETAEMSPEISVVTVTEIVIEYFSVFPVCGLEECFDFWVDRSELNE